MGVFKDYFFLTSIGPSRDQLAILDIQLASYLAGYLAILGGRITFVLILVNKMANN